MVDLLELDPLQDMLNILGNNFFAALKFLAIFWVVHLINRLMSYRLCVFGIIPRHPFGLLGIITSPFIHQDFNHLFFNSVPLFVLSIFVLAGGLDLFYAVTGSIILIAGILIWLIGRPAIHIGASALIMGYWAFVLANAFFQVSMVTILLAVLSLYYFGGLFLSLFPGKAGVSWEGHVCGFIAGVATTFLFTGIKF